MDEGAASVDAVMTAVRAVDWVRFDSPALNYLWHYEPGGVYPAFEQLVKASDAESAHRAESSLLDALSHNHSGTPSPAVVPAGELLVRLVPVLHGWSLHAALAVIGACLHFVHGVHDFRTADGSEHDLTVLQPVIASLRPVLATIVDTGSHEALAPATDLLAAIDDLSPTHGTRAQGTADGA